jgi:glyoxylate/hydroxypyruvate reductase A
MSAANRPTLLLAGRWPDEERDEWLQALRQAVPEARWVVAPCAAAQAADAEIAVVANPPPGALAGLPKLRLIQSLWAGVDRLLADPTLPAGVPIARMVDPAMTEAMVQTALWAVLSLHRGFFDYAAQQRDGLWRQLPQRRADERQVLVLGFGELGQAVARRLAAQGYAVRAWRRREASHAQAPASDDGVTVCSGEAGLQQALAQAHVVVNLLPLTADTRGLFDARCFAAMRRGAALVNLARGAHVVDADLLAALAAGQLSRAVLDVFNEEPLPPGHPYWRHPQVMMLPHAAALTDVRSACAVVAANVQALWRGEPIAHTVERERGY